MLWSPRPFGSRLGAGLATSLQSHRSPTVTSLAPLRAHHPVAGFPDLRLLRALRPVPGIGRRLTNSFRRAKGGSQVHSKSVVMVPEVLPLRLARRIASLDHGTIRVSGSADGLPSMKDPPESDSQKVHDLHPRPPVVAGGPTCGASSGSFLRNHSTTLASSTTSRRVLVCHIVSGASDLEVSRAPRLSR